jgi:hypothetical protein
VRTRRIAAALLATSLAVAGCAGGGDGAPGGILTDRIDDAIFAVETHYQAPQDFFEISATSEQVSVIVAVDDATAAEQAFWDPEDGLVEPVPRGDATGATFRAQDLDFDPDRILDRVAEELPDSEIVDLAITGGGQGAVIYDAQVRSEQGGILLVRLGSDGSILGVQAE